MNMLDSIAQERRARLAAERLLEQKQSELFSANKKLSEHALSLTGQIVEKRQEVATFRHEAEELRGVSTKALSDLEKANHAVVIAERRLWDALETIRDGFAVFDPDNRLVVANSSYLSIFEHMECVAPGTHYDDIVRILVQEGIVNTEGQNEQVWCEDMLTRWQSEQLESFTIKLWNDQYIKLVDRRAEDGGTVSLGLNITETIHTEEQLKEARSKAESANRAKSAFLANMSHELRTPMNGVVGMADLLAETNLNDEQQLFVETIRSSGESLLTLINDVLDFSKIEADKLVLHPQEFDLELCIQNVLLLLQPTVQNKDLDLIIDYDLFLPTQFIGDSGRIRQVLTNLIGNAAKFTRQGHVLVRVVGVASRPGGDYRLHITVEDTGIGIPAGDIAQIFDEFNQVESEMNRAFEGTGLGLAITRQLVDLMGGQIWVDSEEGKGSSFGFHIDLPAVNQADTSVPAVPGWAKRAVVLDGQGTRNAILSKQLSMYGVDVLSTLSRTIAEPSFLQPGDFLLIDQKNFGESGVELLRRLRKSGVTTPALLMHCGSPVDLQDGDHPALVVTKPVSRRSVLTALCDLDPFPTTLPGPASVQGPPAPEMLQPDTGRRMRILAAEDNKTNRLVFSKLVSKLNIELEFATNGREAVEKWSTFKPDLVFMDISMPELDGKEATRAIRKIEANAALKPTTIVALTAHAMDGDDHDILAAGLDHYLTKPLNKYWIFERIRHEVPPHVAQVFSDNDTKKHSSGQVQKALD